MNEIIDTNSSHMQTEFGVQSIVPRRDDWPEVPTAPQMPGGITVRVGTLNDGAFIDQLQKLFSGHLGFLFSSAIEKKLTSGGVLIAEDSAGCPMGYIMGTTGVQGNDAISRIDQIGVVPVKQRRQLGGALLTEWIKRLPYGVRLICCWCAQDLRENRFWESQGFIPLAFRAGGQSKNRMHIFWQRRTRHGDTGMAFWYPKETNNGAMAAARLILPIPPGVNWVDVELPRIMPQGQNTPAGTLKLLPNGLPDPKALPGRTALPGMTAPAQKAIITPAQYAANQRAKHEHLKERRPPGLHAAGRLPCDPPPPPPKEKRPTKPRAKNIPEHVAAARELRDRYLEQVNSAGLMERGKYDPTRDITAAPTALGTAAAGLMDQLQGNKQHQLPQHDPPLTDSGS